MSINPGTDLEIEEAETTFTKETEPLKKDNSEENEIKEWLKFLAVS